MTDDPRPGFNALRDKMLWHLKVHANAKPENNAEGLTNMAFEALGCPGGTAVADEALRACLAAVDRVIDQNDGHVAAGIDWNALRGSIVRGSAALAAPKAEAPEFTDTARAALLWVLWNHQDSRSKVGQAMRFALGMDAHDRLSMHQVSEAKRWAALAPTSPAPQEESHD